MKIAHGFTIIELLVIIIIVAILAAISIVSYNFITDDAKDSSRRAAAKEVQKMTNMLALKKKLLSFGGNSGAINSDGLCPARESGFGGGWVADGGYDYISGCTVGDMLVAANMTSSSFWDNIPKNEEVYTTSRNSTQLATECSGRYFIFYYVKNATPEEVAFVDSIKSHSATCSSRVDNRRNEYKMRAALELSIR